MTASFRRPLLSRRRLSTYYNRNSFPEFQRFPQLGLLKPADCHQLVLVGAGENGAGRAAVCDRRSGAEAGGMDFSVLATFCSRGSNPGVKPLTRLGLDRGCSWQAGLNYTRSKTLAASGIKRVTTGLITGGYYV